MSEFPTLCPNPRCGSEQPDGLLCHKCTGRLMGCLRLLLTDVPPAVPAPKWGRLPGHKEMPIRPLWPAGTIGRRQQLPWETGTEGWTGLDDQLTVSYTRQGQRGSGVGAGKSADTPAPYDEGASGAKELLRNTLTTCIRDLYYDKEPLPRDTFVSMGLWLIKRKERIRHHVAAGEIFTDLVSAIEGARRVIDARPTFGFVGPCPLCGKGDVYAVADAETGVCRHCTEVVPGIPEMRQRNEAEIRGMWVTREYLRERVVPGLTDTYGLTVKDGTLAKWIQRGKLAPIVYVIAVESEDDTEGYERVQPIPLFWVEEVLALIAELRGRLAAKGENPEGAVVSDSMRRLIAQHRNGEWLGVEAVTVEVTPTIVAPQEVSTKRTRRGERRAAV